jgi:hypothetical protein
MSYNHNTISIAKLSLKCAVGLLTTMTPTSARAGKALSTDLSRSSGSAPVLEARTPAIERTRSSLECI